MDKKNENQELVNELTDADLEAVSGGSSDTSIYASWMHTSGNPKDNTTPSWSYGPSASYNFDTGEGKIMFGVKGSF